MTIFDPFVKFFFRLERNFPPSAALETGAMAFQAPLKPIFGKFQSDEKLMNFLAFLSIYREPASNLCNKTDPRHTFRTLPKKMSLDPFLSR
jgi:hypothetical protein